MGSLWTTRRALRLHLTAAVVVPGCLALGWWQLHRALSGNTLSWAYTVEWPVFAAYAVYMWWKLLHDQPAAQGAGEPASGGEVRGAAAGPERVTAAEGGASAARRDPVATGPIPGGDPDGPGDGDERDADELAAYNDYLAALNASGRRKHW